MGTTNYGAQTLVFDYRNPATSTSFNQILYKLLPAGIYEGGLLTKVDNSRVSVSPLECYITDENLKIGVKVTTNEDAIIAVDVDTPYIILRMDWREVPNNYMDIEAVKFDDIQEGDLVVGKVEYTSNTTFLDEFDYTRRDEISYNTPLSEFPFKVRASDPPIDFVFVTGGKIVTKGEHIEKTESPVGPISDTVNGRIDIIFIDLEGIVQHREGVDAEAPTPPDYDGKYVIAEIHRGAGRDTIRGSEIVQINPDARVGLSGGGGGLDWQGSVLDFIDLTTDEPASPSGGERYINTSTGDSSVTVQLVTENYIYEWNGATWTETVPSEGTTALVEDEDKIYTYDGGAWGLFDVNIDHNNVSNIQGGSLTERYHLTQNEHSIVTSNYTISWEDTVTYSANEVVEYNGVLYRALGSSTNHDPVSYLGVDWEEFPHNVLGGKQGGTTDEYYHLTNVQHGILTSNYTISWESAVTYSADEIVEYNGVLYQALQSNSNHNPETYIGVDWQKLTLGAVDWQASVIEQLDLTTAEPSGPSLEDRYLNTVSGTSSATAQSVTADYIYEWNGSSWDEVMPNAGTIVYVEDEKVFYVFDDSAWETLDTYLTHNNLLGLQGGDTDEYFHLNEIDYNAYTNSYGIGWNQYRTYSVGNTVEYNGTLYKALQANTNHNPVTYLGVDWEELSLGGGGGAISEHTAGEDITSNEVVALNTSGEAIVASKSDEAKVEVVGIAIETVTTGNTFDVQKAGLLGGFTGLTAGLPCFLGDNGVIIQDDDDVAIGEYRVYLGIAKSATIIDMNLMEATYNASSSTTEATSGASATTDYIAAESISQSDVIAVNSLGRAIVADKRYSDHVSVVGFATETVTTGQTLTVLKLGQIDGLSGLTPGQVAYLGNNGAVIDDDENINYDEYRVSLGIVKGADTVDVYIGEAGLNQLQEELAVRAFIGQVHGGGIYDAGTDELALRPISLHVNDGLQDWWVEINEETDLSALANYPSTAADSNWFFVLIDRYGNVTLEDSAVSTLTARPTNAFYQWGEYGGTGYDHVRKGYYHSSYSGKKVVGAFAYDLSETTWYIIAQGSETDEKGENERGHWRRVDNEMTQWKPGLVSTPTSSGGFVWLYPVDFYDENKVWNSGLINRSDTLLPKLLPATTPSATKGVDRFTSYVLTEDGSRDTSEQTVTFEFYANGPWHE